jgi:transposase
MNDTQTDKRTKQGGGPAFHSRLEPFVDFIREQRQRRRTWQEIAQLLRNEKDCPITFQGVYQFYRRFLKRQARPHWEREAVPATPTAAPSRKTILAALPSARSFKMPNPDSIKLNDPTNL